MLEFHTPEELRGFDAFVWFEESRIQSQSQGRKARGASVLSRTVRGASVLTRTARGSSVLSRTVRGAIVLSRKAKKELVYCP